MLFSAFFAQVRSCEGKIAKNISWLIKDSNDRHKANR